MKKVKYILLLILIILAVFACSKSTKKKNVDLSGRKINIVTTIGMITDVTRNIGGNRVNVTGLMGPGIDPHLYKASEGDVSSLSKADLVFYSGLHLEAKMGDVLEKMGSMITTVAVTKTLDEAKLISPPEFEGAHDPHVWFDVTLWMKAAEVIRDTLIEVDPKSAEFYKLNAENYLVQLDELNKYVIEQVSRVPEQQRVLITAHDAFNYFGLKYGFDVRGLQGISTVTEAGTKDVQELADFIAINRIPAIFIESSVPVRNIEAVQAAVESRGFNVKIGGELYSDAMGDWGTEDGTYIGMVKHNINTIVKALLGE